MISHYKNTRAARGTPDRNLLIATGILAVLSVGLSFAAHWLSPFPGDLKLTLWFQSLHNSAFLSVMKGVTLVAQGWQSALLVVVSAAVVWWLVGIMQAGLTLAAGLSTGLDSALKLLVGKLRPSSDLVKV